jgi:hypothetical protein
MDTNEKADMITADQKNTLLQHLRSQYILFREEIRSYSSYAAASTTLLALFLSYILTAVRNKDNTTEPKLYLLILIVIVWYGAMMAFFLSYISVMAKYIEAVERKINDLIGITVYDFESNQVFPRKNKLEGLMYGTLLVFLGIPVYGGLCAGYQGLVKGYSVPSNIAFLIILAILIIFIIEAGIVMKIRYMRRKLNDDMIMTWRENLKVNSALSTKV